MLNMFLTLKFYFYSRLQKGLHDNASVYTAWSRLTFYWLTNKTNSREKTADLRALVWRMV